MKSILVFGGNGFLGKRICQEAIHKGFQVTSLSSSGKPPKEFGDWVGKVKWEQANVFEPATYQKFLLGQDAVVHSIGILLENPRYKQMLKGYRSSVFQELSSMLASPNPMEKSSKKTYDFINRQSAVMLAENLAVSTDKPKPAFVYISADKGFPLLPSGYINSKRQAEADIFRLRDKIRPIFMRPGFMHDQESSHDVRTGLYKTIELSNKVDNMILNGFLSKHLIRPSNATQQVAKTLVEKVEDESFDGPVLLEEMLKR